MSAASRAKAILPPSAVDGLRSLRSRLIGSQDIGQNQFTGSSVREDIREKYAFEGHLLDIFADGSEQLVHKWHHYIPIYERYFSPWVGQPVKFLEIGVSKGGSLSMWRKYFGDDAVIFGIDIDPECNQYNGIDGQIRIGSQADKRFLSEVVGEMGGVDVVLDDGSHKMKHIMASLEALFPVLSPSGIYMIEDLHTAYWRRMGGGYHARSNFFNTVRKITDDMHAWYHDDGKKLPEISTDCTGIHVHDSLCVLEKGPVFPPVHSRVQLSGGPS